MTDPGLCPCYYVFDEDVVIHCALPKGHSGPCTDSSGGWRTEPPKRGEPEKRAPEIIGCEGCAGISTAHSCRDWRLWSTDGDG